MRAVVLGAGIGGLCAAAALADSGVTVTVVERDELPLEPVHRPGTPQGRQLHNLLGRGQRELDQLFPEALDRLALAGATRADVASQTHVFELGISMPERACGLHLLTASRPVIEHVLRSLLPSGVDVVDRTRATGLRWNADTIGGVDTDRGSFPADLVVDATGAVSPVLEWTGRSVTVDRVAVRQWYCSLVVRRPVSSRGRPDFWLTFPTFPRTRGGLLSPFGPDRWYASLSGTAVDAPPTTVADFRAYARSLEDPAIGHLLDGAEPESEPTTFGRPVATWRRYELLANPPIGLLPLGDAVAALNPLLGQGISVAAWQARRLGEALRRTGGDRAELTRWHLASAAECAGAAWSLTTLFVTPEGTDQPVVDAEDWAAIATAVSNNGGVHSRYVRVWHLLEPVRAFAEIAAEANR